MYRPLVVVVGLALAAVVPAARAVRRFDRGFLHECERVSALQLSE